MRRRTPPPRACFGAQAAYKRLEAGRRLYGGIASELLRQLRVESKLRAKIFEAIISRAWGLCDALLPQLQQSSGVASAASAEARTLRSELSSSAGFKRRLPCLRVALRCGRLAAPRAQAAPTLAPT